jgi:hypothetical protein
MVGSAFTRFIGSSFLFFFISIFATQPVALNAKDLSAEDFSSIEDALVNLAHCEEREVCKPVAKRLSELYVKQGYLQHGVWALRRAGLSKKAAELQSRLEEELANNPMRIVDSTFDGRAGRKLVRFSSGMKAVLRNDEKEGQPWQYEIAAYELDKLLGLDVIPATVFRSVNGLGASLQYFVQAADSTDYYDAGTHRIQLLDFLTGNTDHLLPDVHNTLVRFGGHLVAFDYGIAFSGAETAITIKDIPRYPLIRLAFLSYSELSNALGAWINDSLIQLVWTNRLKVLERAGIPDMGASGSGPQLSGPQFAALIKFYFDKSEEGPEKRKVSTILLKTLNDPHLRKAVLSKRNLTNPSTQQFLQLHQERIVPEVFMDIRARATSLLRAHPLREMKNFCHEQIASRKF